jgi:uncharacterized membrane protein
MLMGSSSASKIADIAVALAVALMGTAALVVPDLLIRVAPPCLISLLVEDECWGCGITRATVALLHGQFAVAWGLNKLVFFVLPMLMYLYIKHLRLVWCSYLPRRVHC